MDECAGRDQLAGTGVNQEQSSADRTQTPRLTTGRAALAATLLAAGQILAQEAPANPPATPQAPAKVPWAISITVDGYIPPEQDGYVSPLLAVDRGWLHLEARYNYEDFRTGSVWLGYNFKAGKKLVLNFTPMIGVVFGRTTGIAPGSETSVTYRKFTLYIPNEYVFDTKASHGNFYYSAPELTYSPTDWLRVGLAAERNKALKTKLDVDRGFLVGFSHKHAQFTTYVYNVGWTDPTILLELTWSF